MNSRRFGGIVYLTSTWHVIIVLVFSALSHESIAQDQTNFTQFYLNPYILNPSYAGIDGRTALSLIYRKQWMNVDGAPAIANFSLHTPINVKMSTGLSVTNDKRGLLNNTSALFTFGYTLHFKQQQHSFVRFGISAGGSWNTVDWEKLANSGYVDQGIATMQDNHAALAGNAGVSYHNKTFNIGVSIPAIFQPSYFSEDAFNISEVKPFQNIIIHASNRFYFSDDKHVFEPYVAYRLNTGIPSQFEVAGVLHLNHMVWVGSSFKQDFGISAMAGLKLKNMLAIGGSYSLQNSGTNELNSPTMEFSLGYLFGTHKKGTPVYSFVDTHKEKIKKQTKSASEALAAKHKQEEEARKKQLQEQAEKKKIEDALARKKQEEALALHREEVKKREEARKAEVVIAPPPVKVDTVKKHNPRFKQDMLEPVEIPEGHHEHEQEQLKRLDIHAENPTETHDETHHPHAERHEFVKRGAHQEELDVSDYVIGGVFGKEANAKHFADGLAKLGFKADYGHLTEKNLWYVYVTQTNDINVARAERDKYRKMKILRDAWLLTVHH